MRFTPYLYFKGECENALKFYEACGLGRIEILKRYGDSPLADRDGGGWRDKVLHAYFEGSALRLFAGDGADSEPMKGCAIFIEPEGVAQAEALFASLSAGGRITVPFRKQFWGEFYGNFTDRFGVQWAMNCSADA